MTIPPKSIICPHCGAGASGRKWPPFLWVEDQPVSWPIVAVEGNLVEGAIVYMSGDREDAFRSRHRDANPRIQCGTCGGVFPVELPIGDGNGMIHPTWGSPPASTTQHSDCCGADMHQCEGGEVGCFHCDECGLIAMDVASTLVHARKHAEALVGRIVKITHPIDRPPFFSVLGERAYVAALEGHTIQLRLLHSRPDLDEWENRVYLYLDHSLDVAVSRREIMGLELVDDCCCHGEDHEGPCCPGWAHFDEPFEIERCDECYQHLSGLGFEVAIETDADAQKYHDLECKKPNCKWKGRTTR